MRRLAYLLLPTYSLLVIGSLACGTHAAAEHAEAAAGCPAPVDCNVQTNCDVPNPESLRCGPFTDFFKWTECSNGDIVISRADENAGSASYYRDGKLVAVFGGQRRSRA